MTYCLAMRLNEGLLFLADTRTNAGVDNVGTYRKLHVIAPSPDRVFVLQSAGSLATTQEVLDRIERDLTSPGEHGNLGSVQHLFEAALYIGKVSREVVAAHREALGSAATATFILGGQIAGERPDIILLYPEGNYIKASETLPFLQIGETKYGKFLLEVAAHEHVGIEAAAKIALSSMLSTARANISVGPPYDLGIYRNGSLVLEQRRIEADAPYLDKLQEVWATHMLGAIDQLPPIPDGFFDT